MQTTDLTARQQREKAYYDQYSQKFDLESYTVNFDPVLGKETRPWNSYWAMYHLAKDLYKEGNSLLDFGCGHGENAMRYAKLGYKVVGFDISDANVSVANQLAGKYQANASFEVSTAENLPYDNNSFSVISGVDILHHVDIRKSLQECHRVLTSDGVAFFREPVEAPFLDTIRNSKLVTFFVPNEASLEAHITEDERKLNEHDEKIMKEIFPVVEKRYFLFLSRFDKFFREGSDPKSSTLEKIDFYLLKAFPFLKRLCGAVIYVLKK